PLRALFDAPTVHGLAAVLATALRGGGVPSPRIPRARRGDRAPVSFQQERMWFLDRFEAGGSTFSITAALRLAGELDMAALERALGELARRHETLRTRFESEDGRPVQVVEPPRPTFLAPVDLTGAPDPQRELRIRVEAEAAAPFDLARGP